MKARNGQQFGQVAVERSKAVACWQLVAGANLMAISWTDCQTHANNSLVEQLATHFRQSATDRGSQPSRGNDDTDRQSDRRTDGQLDTGTFTLSGSRPIGRRQNQNYEYPYSHSPRSLTPNSHSQLLCLAKCLAVPVGS